MGGGARLLRCEPEVVLDSLDLFGCEVLRCGPGKEGEGAEEQGGEERGRTHRGEASEHWQGEQRAQRQQRGGRL